MCYVIRAYNLWLRLTCPWLAIHHVGGPNFLCAYICDASIPSRDKRALYPLPKSRTASPHHWEQQHQDKTRCFSAAPFAETADIPLFRHTPQNHHHGSCHAVYKPLYGSCVLDILQLLRMFSLDLSRDLPLQPGRDGMYLSLMGNRLCHRIRHLQHLPLHCLGSHSQTQRRSGQARRLPQARITRLTPPTNRAASLRLDGKTRYPLDHLTNRRGHLSSGNICATTDSVPVHFGQLSSVFCQFARTLGVYAGYFCLCCSGHCQTSVPQSWSRSGVQSVGWIDINLCRWNLLPVSLWRSSEKEVTFHRGLSRSWFGRLRSGSGCISDGTKLLSIDETLS